MGCVDVVGCFCRVWVNMCNLHLLGDVGVTSASPGRFEFSVDLVRAV